MLLIDLIIVIDKVMLKVSLYEFDGMPILWLENTIRKNFQNYIDINFFIFEHFANFHHHVKDQVD